MKISLLDLLKKITSPNSTVEKNSAKEIFGNRLEQSYKEFKKLSQEEKDNICIELAQGMGCLSNTVEECSAYIYLSNYDADGMKVQ